jgi:hypothetical protein
MLQRSRDVVTGPITLDYLVQKAAEGWKVAAVEWVRQVGDTAQPEPSGPHRGEEIPYGLRLSEGGSQLEEHPVERTVLLLILENIVHEKRITEIAMELNAGGLRTRQGGAWSPSAVFELLPRLIETGPSLLKSADWQNVRNRRAMPNENPPN